MQNYAEPNDSVIAETIQSMASKTTPKYKIALVNQCPLILHVLAIPTARNCTGTYTGKCPI